MDTEIFWNKIKEEAKEIIKKEPLLGSYFLQSIINQKSFSDALSFQLSNKLGTAIMPTVVLLKVLWLI